jgi:hypothetical protein
LSGDIIGDGGQSEEEAHSEEIREFLMIAKLEDQIVRRI